MGRQDKLSAMLDRFKLTIADGYRRLNPQAYALNVSQAIEDQQDGFSPFKSTGLDDNADRVSLGHGFDQFAADIDYVPPQQIEEPDILGFIGNGPQFDPAA